MRNQADVHYFQQLALPFYPHEGDVWVTGEDIGNALGYDQPGVSIRVLYNRHAEELSEYSTLIKLIRVEGGTQKEREVRVFNEEGAMVLTMLSRQPIAAAFRKWVVGILRAYRRGELHASLTPIEARLLNTCIREATHGNVAAIDTLVNRFGYRKTLLRDQLRAMAIRRGRDPRQMAMFEKELQEQDEIEEALDEPTGKPH